MTAGASSAANDVCEFRRSSGDLLPPSPPAEKTAARQDQAGKACTSDGGGNAYGAKQPVRFAVDSIGEEQRVGAPIVAPGPEAEGPKAAWRVAEANINRDRAQECPVERVEGVNLAGDEAEIADQQVVRERTETGRGDGNAPGCGEGLVGAAEDSLKSRWPRSDRKSPPLPSQEWPLSGLDVRPAHRSQPRSHC